MVKKSAKKVSKEIKKISAVELPAAGLIKKPLLLDIGCGNNKQPDHTGIDISPDCGADVIHDVRITPWPFEDNSVEGIFCNHFFEHLTGEERMRFMNEAFRVMKVGAELKINVPAPWSDRAIQDPTHQWPPVCGNSFWYFSKEWREVNKLTHYPIYCDFEFAAFYVPDQEITHRNNEFLQFSSRYYVNAMADMNATLKKK